MDQILNTVTVSVLVVVAVLYVAFDYFYGFKYDTKEPPLIPQSIPYVGHLIGIIRDGPSYYTKISKKHPLPIYTLGMLNGRTYVVNSIELITAVQRNPKTLAFYPLILEASKRLSGCSEDGMQVVRKNAAGDEGDHGMVIDTSRGMHAVMAPGKELNEMNAKMIEGISAALDELASQDGVLMDLYQWCRHTITIASTDAVYGPMNPYLADPLLEDNFWDFEAAMGVLLLDIMPSLTARKGYLAREKASKLFAEYFQKRGFEQGSGLIKIRASCCEKFAFPWEDMGRFEWVNNTAILVNTTPTSFWTIYHIFSNPELLEEIREELNAALTVERKGEEVVRRVDISLLKTNCPLLLSVYQELLRLKTVNASSRVVMKDMVLNDQYLLKKGSVVQMPAAVTHRDTAAWGSSAADFDARRFIAQQKKELKMNPVAFRSFGGGTTLCPGRHFATTEVMSVVAMFVMRFDLKPIDGTWKLLKLSRGSLVSSVIPPSEDIKVKVMKRKGFDDGKWEFILSESTTRFPLATG